MAKSNRNRRKVPASRKVPSSAAPPSNRGNKKNTQQRRQTSSKSSARRQAGAGTGSAGMSKRRSKNTLTRRQRKNRRVTQILLLLVLLVLGVVLSLTVFFKIEDIVVIGSQHYTPEEIIQASGIHIEDNLFLVKTHEVAQNLLDQFPYLEEVSVTRTFPPSIEIETVPSVAVAVLEQKANDYILITYNGKILEQGLSLPAWDALLVHGVPIRNLVPGQHLGDFTPQTREENETAVQKAERLEIDKDNRQIAEDQKEVLRMLQYLFEAMESTGFDAITNIDLTDRYNMTVQYENRMVLELGTEVDLAYKLKYAKEVLEHHLHPEAPGALDLSSIRQNRVYYKPPEDYRNDGTHQDDPPFEPGQTVVAEEDSPKDTDLSPGEDAEDSSANATEESPRTQIPLGGEGETQDSTEFSGDSASDAQKEAGQRVIIPLEDLG